MTDIDIPKKAPTLWHAVDLQSLRLRADATNRLVPVVAPGAAGGSLSLMVEIFDTNGSQEPNSHPDSDEIFFFIRGSGLAYCDGQTVNVSAGDVLVLPAGSLHYIQNTGGDRLYAITILVNDDGSHEGITATLSPLDASDLAALTNAPT